MQIVELGDCSMVIMKDSEDPPWVSVGDIYRKAEGNYKVIVVEKVSVDVFSSDAFALVSHDYIYSAGRLVLFFTDSIGSCFHLHDKVDLRVLATRRSKRK